MVFSELRRERYSKPSPERQKGNGRLPGRRQIPANSSTRAHPRSVPSTELAGNATRPGPGCLPSLLAPHPAVHRLRGLGPAGGIPGAATSYRTCLQLARPLSRYRQRGIVQDSGPAQLQHQCDLAGEIIETLLCSHASEVASLVAVEGRIDHDRASRSSMSRRSLRLGGLTCRLAKIKCSRLEILTEWPRTVTTLASRTRSDQATG